MNIAEHVFMALANTIGEEPGLRAHHDKLPKVGTAEYILPMVVIQTIGGNDDMTLFHGANLRWRLMQLDTWGSYRQSADDYMELVRARMLAYQHFKVGAIDVSGAPGYDYEANLFRASVEFRIWFNVP